MSFAELWNETTGNGKGQWLCPSYLTLVDKDAFDAAPEHTKPVPLDWHRAVNDGRTCIHGPLLRISSHVRSHRARAQ